jgi:two-component system response regulator PilR (NtrC family)
MEPRILVCEDDADQRKILQHFLTGAGYAVEMVPRAADGLDLIATSEPFDAVVTDLVLPDGSGMQLLEAARARDDLTQVIVITGHATTERAVDAMRKGAYDFFEKPFRNTALCATLDKALEKRAIVAENLALRAEVEERLLHSRILAASRRMKDIVKLITRIADSPSSVLITGESGTGKELVARALHEESGRADMPFVPVDCGALPEALMESELFGHEKGAFTGAHERRQGLFRAAKGGTLLLDEIGELPLGLQVKLLRVLQERVVRPVGSTRDIPIEVRVVAATNQDVKSAVEEGRFRQDLFYRLNVIHFHLPPLRERRDDVPLLAKHFLTKHSTLHNKRLTFAPDAMRWLVSQPFHGNVRELENLVERALTLALGDRIELTDFLDPENTFAPLTNPSPGITAGDIDLDSVLEETEKQLLNEALESADGVRTRAAKTLGISFRSLRYRLAKYDLDPDEAADDRDS